MQKLVSIALCSLAAAAFALPAVAADEGTAKARAGANASVEGGTSLGGTGVSSGANAGVNAAGSGTVKQETTGDAQARRDNNEDESKTKPAKPAKRAKRKAERNTTSGATAPSRSY